MDNRTVRLAREVGHAHSLGMALCFSAMLHQFLREPKAVRKLAQETLILSKDQGLSDYAPKGEFLLGWAIVQEGQYDRGLRQMRESIAQYRRSGGALDLNWYLGLLAEASLTTGEIEEGLRTLEEAHELTRSNVNISIHTPDLYRIKGRLRLAQNSQDEAEQSFLLSLDASRQRGAKALELRAATSLAHLWRDLGKHSEARDLLAPVCGCFTEGFDTIDLKNAKALLAELSA
jgi:adenylate cyclase